MNCKCNCKCRNGQDARDFLLLAPGSTATEANYAWGVTHYTTCNRKLLAFDPLHPVTCDLQVVLEGQPQDIGNGLYCQEVAITGTVKYKPCNCQCNSPQEEYVNDSFCLTLSSATQPTVTIGAVVASPKPVTYYKRTACGCCKETEDYTNQIAITTSINVATA